MLTNNVVSFEQLGPDVDQITVKFVLRVHPKKLQELAGSCFTNH